MSKNIGKIIAGVGLGVGLGMLFAPEKGKDTRKKLANKLNEMCESVKSIDKDDVKKKIEKQIKEIKKELSDLDKEKALKIAKEKGNKIVKKSEELYKLAVEKGKIVRVDKNGTVLDQITEERYNQIKRKSEKNKSNEQSR